MQNQLDIFGFQIAYECKKCSRCFPTMKQISKHCSKHKKEKKPRISINFCLENYSLISTKKIEI